MYDTYTKQHILEYVRFQLKHGYFIEDIMNTLIQYGYPHDLVDEIVYEIGDVEATEKKHQGKDVKQTKKADLKQLKADLIIYTQELLIDYICKQLEQGYVETAIRRALLKQGHHEELIDNAFDAIYGGKVVIRAPKPGFSLPLGFLFITSIMFLLVAAFVISIGVNETLFVVLITLAPVFVCVGVIYFILSAFKMKFIVQSTPIISIVIVIGLFAYLLNYSEVYAKKDPTILLVINIVLAIIFSSYMAILKRRDFNPPSQPKIVEDHQLITEEDIADAQEFSEKYDEEQHKLLTKAVKESIDPRLKDDLDSRGGLP